MITRETTGGDWDKYRFNGLTDRILINVLFTISNKFRSYIVYKMLYRSCGKWLLVCEIKSFQ